MANSSERALPPMELSGSVSKVAERWRQWKRSYEYYIDRKGITQAGRKKSKLVHLAGLEVQDIFEDLVAPGPINATTEDAYKVCLRKLDAGDMRMSLMYRMNDLCFIAIVSRDRAGGGAGGALAPPLFWLLMLEH